MLNQVTLDKMHQLKLYGMSQAWQNMDKNIEHTTLTLDEGLGMLIDHELTYRQNNKEQRLLKNAKLRYPDACVEDINYQHKRALPRETLQQLLSCQWLTQGQNIILTGPTGVGKTYLACAIAQNACRSGYSARYYRLSKLLEQLRIAYADGSYTRLLGQLLKVQCLIIDDWGIEPIDQQHRNQLLEIIDDRYKQHALIIATQLPQENWHDYIGDATVADAILDRVIHKAINIDLQGESMRKVLDAK